MSQANGRVHRAAAHRAPRVVARARAARDPRFSASRLVIHVEHWLTEVGFVVPGTARGLATAALHSAPPRLARRARRDRHRRERRRHVARLADACAERVFAGLLAYLALADRLEAFTVNKLGTVVAIALFATPPGVALRHRRPARRTRGPATPGRPSSPGATSASSRRCWSSVLRVGHRQDRRAVG